MNEAIRIAEERGGKRLLVGVYRENLSAIRFYEKAGFAVIGERLFRVGKRMLPDLVKPPGKSLSLRPLRHNKAQDNAAFSAFLS